MCVWGGGRRGKGRWGYSRESGVVRLVRGGVRGVFG